MMCEQVAGKYDYSVLVSLGLGSAVYLAIKTLVRCTSQIRGQSHAKTTVISHRSATR
jgi:hypothetical protein